MNKGNDLTLEDFRKTMGTMAAGLDRVRIGGLEYASMLEAGRARNAAVETARLAFKFGPEASKTAIEAELKVAALSAERVAAAGEEQAALRAIIENVPRPDAPVEDTPPPAPGNPNGGNDVADHDQQGIIARICHWLLGLFRGGTRQK